MTYNELRDKLHAAVRSTFVGWSCVEDFDDATVWVEAEGPTGSTYYAVPYTVAGDGVELGQPVQVREVTTYEPVDKVMLSGDFTTVSKDEDQRLIFGWANVSVRKDGTRVVDSDGEHVPIEDLEAAAYLFVKEYRGTGEDHQGEQRGVLVESMVFTAEKRAAMGLPEGSTPDGWWVGFQLDDAADFAKVKEGQKLMFSIQGHARPEQVAA